MPCGDTGVLCWERNATDPEQPLDSVMGHTGFVSSSSGAFCDGNNLVKSQTWLVDGVIPFYIQTASAMGECPLKLGMR